MHYTAWTPRLIFFFYASIKWSNNKCLDLTNGVTTTGNQVQIWSCNSKEDNNNQIWDAGYMYVPSPSSIIFILQPQT